MKLFKKMSLLNSIKFTFTASLFFLIACTGEPGKGTAESGNGKAPAITIHEAVFMGNLKSIEKHLAAGTDLNKKDAYGSSPLAIAATFGKTEAARALIKGGADLNVRGGDGSTPLHTAAFFCRTEIVGDLLAAGADASLRNHYGSTALESVSTPFEDVKAIYDQISKDLGPLGLKLDYDQLRNTRPVIVKMLSENQL